MRELTLLLIVTCLVFSPSISLQIPGDSLLTPINEEILPQIPPVITVVDHNLTTPIFDFNSTNFTLTTTTESDENLEDLENLLNVTTELKLEKVNKDEDCLRQLIISDKCLKKVIFMAKDSSLPRSLNEASAYCR